MRCPIRRSGAQQSRKSLATLRKSPPSPSVGFMPYSSLPASEIRPGPDQGQNQQEEGDSLGVARQSSTAVAVISIRNPSASNSFTTTVARTGKGGVVK